MKRFAILNQYGEVVNIVADFCTITPSVKIAAGVSCNIGDTWTGTEFVPAPEIKVPYRLEKATISKRLFKIGKLAAFDNLLEQDVAAKRLWNDEPYVMSNNADWLHYQVAFIPLLEMTADEVAYVAKEGTEV